MNFAKKFLGSMTMYRLMLYYLRFLIGAVIVLSFFKILPYTWWLLLIQYLTLVFLCYGFNYLFAYSVGTKPNYESPSISGMILTLIAGPITALDLQNFLLLAVLALVAMGSKYIFVVNKRHIFNPAAAGVMGAALILGQGASWWVGNQFLIYFVVAGGLLVVYKIRRFHLILSFLLAYVLLIGLDNYAAAGGLTHVYRNLVFSSPLLFFTLVMLPEPLTGPQDRSLRIYYGVVIGALLFALQKFLAVPYTLELSLLAGNVFARIVNPDLRLTLRLIKKEIIDTNVLTLWFEPIRKFAFTPGQFLEYTLPHPKPDSRGLRRFFTIAASPTENRILIATRISEKGSSFKNKLEKLGLGDEIIASGLEGNFVLPKDSARKIVFIAGGIGITPFRSIIKSLLDGKQGRDIVLLYSNRTPGDIVFKEIFDEAEAQGWLKPVYVLTEKDKVPKNWKGETGFIDPAMIKKQVPDYAERLFYVSGPEPMVEAFEKMLYEMELPKKQVKRDYFPGYTETHQA